MERDPLLSLSLPLSRPSLSPPLSRPLSLSPPLSLAPSLSRPLSLSPPLSLAPSLSLVSDGKYSLFIKHAFEGRKAKAFDNLHDLSVIILITIN